MKKYMENVIPAIVIVVLIIIFALLVGRKVYAKSVEEVCRAQREAMESTYITAIKGELSEAGFRNSGVNMTKATNGDGEWEYTVTIYHRSFEWMEETARIQLEKELADMGNEELGKISLRLLAR